MHSIKKIIFFKNFVFGSFLCHMSQASCVASVKLFYVWRYVKFLQKGRFFFYWINNKMRSFLGEFAFHNQKCNQNFKEHFFGNFFYVLYHIVAKAQNIYLLKNSIWHLYWYDNVNMYLLVCYCVHVYTVLGGICFDQLHDFSV